MNRYISSVTLASPVPPNSYLAGLPVVRHLAQGGPLRFTSPVTFLVGENGTGKSTLLEGIAVAYGFNPEGGTRNFNFSTSATHSALYQHLTLTKQAFAKDGFFLRAESFYNASSYLDQVYEGDPERRRKAGYGEHSLHERSHGESFLDLVQHRFKGEGLYLLDEPEAALSPTRLLTLLAQLHELVGQGSQFIIATHSPILMAYPEAEVFELTSSGIASVDYRQTEHFQLTRRFLENPEKMLYYLLNDEV